MLKHIPNALTLTRLILAPVIAWQFWEGAQMFGYMEGVGDETYARMTTSLAIAAGLFVIAALTDLFDGMAARAFNAQSKFGRVIDPIADKALVGLPLIAIVLAEWGKWAPDIVASSIVTAAVTIIVVRDVSMTVVRLLAPDGEGATVSSLAKMKTALELFVVGAFLVGVVIEPHLITQILQGGGDSHILWIRIRDASHLIWVGLLVVTAALSAYTGWQYLRPTKKS